MNKIIVVLTDFFIKLEFKKKGSKIMVVEVRLVIPQNICSKDKRLGDGLRAAPHN